MLLFLAATVVLTVHLILTRFADSDIGADSFVSFAVAFIVAGLFVVFRHGIDDPLRR